MKLEIVMCKESQNPEDYIVYSHDGDAGADIIMQEDITLKSGKNVIPLGFKLVLPQGLAGYVFPRSSMMGEGITFNLAPIDPGYSGEWHIIAYNHGNEVNIRKGQRICQVVFMPFIQVDFVNKLNNCRSDGGIGSTGI